MVHPGGRQWLADRAGSESQCCVGASDPELRDVKLRHPPARSAVCLVTRVNGALPALRGTNSCAVGNVSRETRPSRAGGAGVVQKKPIRVGIGPLTDPSNFILIGAKITQPRTLHEMPPPPNMGMFHVKPTLSCWFQDVSRFAPLRRATRESLCCRVSIAPDARTLEKDRDAVQNWRSRISTNCHRTQPFRRS